MFSRRGFFGVFAGLAASLGLRPDFNPTIPLESPGPAFMGFRVINADGNQAVWVENGVTSITTIGSTGNASPPVWYDLTEVSFTGTAGCAHAN